MLSVNIIVTEYQLEWQERYRQEAEKIKTILGKNLIAIHHIGSTSVKGLKAKPIIDLMPVVQSLEQADLCNAAFASIGYECMGEFGILGRRYFRKGGENRTHHIHLFQQENKRDIERHLAVRNYLRSHPQDAMQYGILKQQLAKQFSKDNEGYCNGKDAFVKQLEQKALYWYYKNLPSSSS